MRLGWVASLFIHLCAALLTVVAWPQREFDSERRGVQATPVDVVSLSDVASALARAPPAPPEEEEGAPDEPEPIADAVPPPLPAPSMQPRPTDYAALREKLLLDQQKERTSRTTPNTAPGPRQPRIGDGSRESATIASRVAALLQRHMVRCWRSSVDAGTDPGRLVVVLEINLDARGRLQGQPRVLRPTNVAGDPELRVARDRAVRAVLDCDPYPFPDDPVVADHYDFWRSNTYTFRPEE